MLKYIHSAGVHFVGQDCCCQVPSAMLLQFTAGSPELSSVRGESPDIP
jgi:hypothetical protein